MNKETVEYTLIFKKDTELYEQYNGEYTSEDIDDTNEIFTEYKQQVRQYFSKKWILIDNDWIEDYVEVYYE